MSRLMLPPEPLRADLFATLRDLTREGPVEVTVRGSCMAPRIADGDRVRIAAARLYLPGDVVVFQAGDGRLRLHRLLGYRPFRNRVALVTRGDRCPCHDGAIPLHRVLGRVVAPVGIAARLRAALSAFSLAFR